MLFGDDAAYRIQRISGAAFWVAISAVAVIAAPFFATPYEQSLLLVLFMYIAIALSWNVIGGYTGYFSFGHVAYFGLGCYVGALLVADFGMNWLFAAAIAAITAAVAALIVGYPSLAVKGPAFAIVTLAFSQALRVIVYIFDKQTGGGYGLSLPPIPSLLPVYFAFAAAALIAVMVTMFIEGSRFGRNIKAIRDDEFAAEAIGIDTRTEKLKAFVLSAVLPGFCGSIYGWYLSYVHPEEAFSLRINIGMIVMVLLGGAGTVFGPVLGAAIVLLVSELLWARFPVLYQLFFGLLLMTLVLFAPDGLLGIFRRRPKRPFAA